MWKRPSIRGITAESLLAAIAVLGGCQPTAGTRGQTTHGWEFTTYYTAVESFHKGPAELVRGCPILDCAHGHTVLGSYPRGFVQAVHDEGAGRITTGRHRGRYLNWSYDVGYWLDTAARDTDGRPLRPYVTAAADASALPKYATFRIVACGREVEDNSAINARVCAKLRASSWKILDAFTPGLGGHRHIDLYVGEENRPDFPDTSPSSITTTGSVIRRTR